MAKPTKNKAVKVVKLAPQWPVPPEYLDDDDDEADETAQGIDELAALNAHPVWGLSLYQAGMLWLARFGDGWMNDDVVGDFAEDDINRELFIRVGKAGLLETREGNFITAHKLIPEKLALLAPRSE